MKVKILLTPTIMRRPVEAQKNNKSTNADTKQTGIKYVLQAANKLHRLASGLTMNACRYSFKSITR
jgi:hypothetical protein